MQNESNQNDDFMLGEISISPQHNMITRADKICRVQPKAMAVLHYLAQHKDRVINNDELLEHVWQGRVVTHSSIQKSINALRSAFKELDSSSEYVLYFSKRGYQVVSPDGRAESSAATTQKASPYHRKVFATFITVIALTIITAYSAYQYLAVETTAATSPADLRKITFRQVKPFVSNTGREKLVAPHFKSNRVAFIRDEYSEISTTSNKTETRSHLYIQGTNGQQWRVSIARGNFINLAWSASGRNLVAIDAHYDNPSPSKEDKSFMPYHSLHIYTLDYKAEKIIEKNLLSHWAGNINSVAWWDEGTLEFIASHGNNYPYERYRYDIAEQNLLMLEHLAGQKGQPVGSAILNKKTALLSSINSKANISILDADQQPVANWPIPFTVKSMDWLSEAGELLLLSDKSQLFALNADGYIQPINYSPNVKGNIQTVRTANKGKSIVLTVDSAPIESISQLSAKAVGNDMKTSPVFSQARFLEKGGGFIYNTTITD